MLSHIPGTGDVLDYPVLLLYSLFHHSLNLFG